MSCETIRSISDGFASKARKANRAISGLQVLAELLEDQIDFAEIAIDPSSLIDPGVLTLDTLENLRWSCPGLGIPLTPGVADLQRIQNLLRNAYWELREKLDLSHILRLDKYQAKLNEIRARIALTASEVQAYLDCAAAACEQSQTITEELESKTAEVAQYTENFINGTGQVASDTATNAVISLNTTSALLNQYSTAP